MVGSVWLCFSPMLVFIFGCTPLLSRMHSNTNVTTEHWVANVLETFSCFSCLFSHGRLKSYSPRFSFVILERLYRDDVSLHDLDLDFEPLIMLLMCLCCVGVGVSIYSCEIVCQCVLGKFARDLWILFNCTKWADLSCIMIFFYYLVMVVLANIHGQSSYNCWQVLFWYFYLYLYEILFPSNWFLQAFIYNFNN